MASRSGNDPSKTYTLDAFIALRSQDETTFHKFTITSGTSIELVDQNILDYYMNELKSICETITTFSEEEINKYRYAPDLLAYDIYGSTQLDFIVLLCNGIIDPKEFDFKRGYIYLPKASNLRNFLSQVYNKERDWKTMKMF